MLSLKFAFQDQSQSYHSLNAKRIFWMHSNHFNDKAVLEEHQERILCTPTRSEWICNQKKLKQVGESSLIIPIISTQHVCISHEILLRKNWNYFSDIHYRRNMCLLDQAYQPTGARKIRAGIEWLIAMMLHLSYSP